MPPKDQSSSYNGLDSDKIYIPYSTMVRDLPPADENFHPGILSDLIYVPASLSGWKEARARSYARAGAQPPVRSPDTGALYLWDTVENAELVDRMFTSMTIFLGIIALVTLTLGGVGVMNIMLVSVSERTQEIGLRKAVGATRRRILSDFFVEGVLLAVLSGVGGWSGGLWTGHARQSTAASRNVRRPAGERGHHRGGLRRAGRHRGGFGHLAGLARRPPDARGGAAL